MAKPKIDPCKFWQQQYPGIDATARKSSGQGATLPEFITGLDDMMQFLYLCNPYMIAKDVHGKVIPNRHTWKIASIKSKCS